MFRSPEYMRKLKLHEGPYGMVYQATVLLWSLKWCYYGSNASQYVGFQPPSLDQYLQLLRLARSIARHK